MLLPLPSHHVTCHTYPSSVPPSTDVTGLVVVCVGVSVNGGSQWTLLAGNTGASNRSQSTLLFDANGYLYLLFGQWANPVPYTWQTDAFKSTLSFNNISQWASSYGLTLPSTPVAVNSSSSTPTGGQYSTYPKVVQQTCISLTGAPVAAAGATFTWNQVTQTGQLPYSRADSTIAPITAPLLYPVVYQSNGLDYAYAPTGSWLLWGTQQDVSLSTNQGQTWSLIAGVTYAGLSQPGVNDFGFAYGADQCQHRNTFNRFYVIGNGSAGAVNSAYYVWASNNGWEWTSVLDGATTIAFNQRANVDFAACVVDMRDRVYSIGGTDVWVSTNLGVTFNPRGQQNMFTPRNNFGSGIFTNSSGGDIIVVMGGIWNNVDLNDVWITTNGAYTWTLASAAAPWSARDSPNVAISNYGVIALYGGAAYGGYGGWYDDTWVSVNGGSTWTLLSGNAVLTNRSQASIVFDQSGYLYVFFGQGYPSYTWLSDGWKSTYSFNTISQWGPIVNSAFAVPNGYSSCSPIPTYGGAASTTPGSSSSSSSSSGLSGGAIAGIVIGSLVGAIIILIVVLVACRSMSTGKKSTDMDRDTSSAPAAAGRYEHAEEPSTHETVEMN